MQRKTVTMIGLSALAACALLGISVWLAVGSEGQIDVPERITEVDPATLTQPIVPTSPTSVPNGGLRPQGDAPVNPAPVPESQNVSSTEATSTDTGANEAAPEGEAAEEASAEEGGTETPPAE